MLSIQAAIKMFCEDSGLITHEQAKICYGLSKMTIVDEGENNAKYMRINFTEWLEMIARVGLVWWDLNGTTEIDLA